MTLCLTSPSPAGKNCAIHPKLLTRRGALGTLAALPAAFHAATHANNNNDDRGVIRLAQSTALSGPLGELGSAMHQGAKACFLALNAKGGVNGRLIELTTADDGYDVQRALSNIKSFISDGNNFALFNCMGTPMIEAMLGRVIESGMPFFAPFTGALSAHPKLRQMSSTSWPATRMKLSC